MTTVPLPRLTRYRCAICNARLREGRYSYSRFTGNRYCLNIERHVKTRAKS